MTTQRFLLLMVTNNITLLMVVDEDFKINIQDDWLKNDFYPEAKVQTFMLKLLVSDLSL